MWLNNDCIQRGPICLNDIAFTLISPMLNDDCSHADQWGPYIVLNDDGSHADQRGLPGRPMQMGRSRFSVRVPPQIVEITQNKH